MSKLKTSKKIYKILGMECPSCAMVIESELEDIGIKCKYNYAKETLEIENYENISEEKIQLIVEKSGYKLNPSGR